MNIRFSCESEAFLFESSVQTCFPGILLRWCVYVNSPGKSHRFLTVFESCPGLVKKKQKTTNYQPAKKLKRKKPIYGADSKCGFQVLWEFHLF